jgi:hypothetical protein
VIGVVRAQHLERVEDDVTVLSLDRLVAVLRREAAGRPGDSGRDCPALAVVRHSSAAAA